MDSESGPDATVVTVREPMPTPRTATLPDETALHDRLLALVARFDQRTVLVVGDLIADDRHKAPDLEMLDSDSLKHVFKMLGTMDEREATILRMRFGLDDSEPRTLKEIGEALGLTRERVRQIESEALGRIAASLEGRN